jgi:hypothetical protein
LKIDIVLEKGRGVSMGKEIGWSVLWIITLPHFYVKNPRFDDDGDDVKEREILKMRGAMGMFGPRTVGTKMSLHFTIPAFLVGDTGAMRELRDMSLTVMAVVGMMTDVGVWESQGKRGSSNPKTVMVFQERVVKKRRLVRGHWRKGWKSQH